VYENPALTLDAAVHESNPASVCWQSLPEYPAVMRDRRVHACVAQGTPERYLIGGENDPAPERQCICSGDRACR